MMCVLCRYAMPGNKCRAGRIPSRDGKNCANFKPKLDVVPSEGETVQIPVPKCATCKNILKNKVTKRFFAYGSMVDVPVVFCKSLASIVCDGFTPIIDCDMYEEEKESNLPSE